MIHYQRELAIANVEPGKTAAAVNTKFGTRLTRRQVAYHQGFATVASSLSDAEELEQATAASNGSGSASPSGADSLIETLKKKSYLLCPLPS